MSKSFMANMCCSFELEPQTLSEDQLDQAREVAQNLKPSEASTLLSEGFKGDARNGTAKHKGKNNGDQVHKVELHSCREHKDDQASHCISTTTTSTTTTS